MTRTTLNDQAGRLHQALTELARNLQFRDRDRICCHGISVTQCYALQELETAGPIAMGELAERLMLEISSATRAADGLVRQKLIERIDDPNDRRIRRVRLTRKGKTLLGTIHAESVVVLKDILAQVPAGSRNDVLDALERLTAALSQCCKPECCRDE